MSELLLTWCRTMSVNGIAISLPVVVATLATLCVTGQIGLALVMLRSKTAGGESAFGADSVPMAEVVLALAER
jgi:hypothetical protein